MELDADGHRSFNGRVMAAITHICTLDYIAKMLDEDVELLEDILYNHENLTYESIIPVYLGPDETISALTDDRIEDLTDLIKAARLTTRTWHKFLDGFVDDKDLVLRIKAKSPR